MSLFLALGTGPVGWAHNLVGCSCMWCPTIAEVVTPVPDRTSV